MKKFITMALVLVMALGLAAPALAYTTNEAPAQGVSPYTVDMYLVEFYSSDILDGWIGAPPTDRGYAKNEIIAGIGALNVPADYNVYTDGYRGVKFTGKNVTLDVMDNRASVLIGATSWLLFSLNHTVPNTNPLTVNWNNPNNAATVNPGVWVNAAGPTIWYINGDGNVLTHRIAGTGDIWRIPKVGSAKTYRFLVFGKVTDDDAKLTFSLSRLENFNSPDSKRLQDRANDMDFPFAMNTTNSWNQGVTYGAGILPNLATQTGLATVTLAAPPVQGMLILSEEILVGRTVDEGTGSNRYYVFKNTKAGFEFNKVSAQPGDILFIIDTGSRGRTEALYMFPNGPTGTGYRIHVEPSTQELVFINLRSNSYVDQVKFGHKDYAPLRAFYDQWFEGALGFTAFNEGNLLNASDWHALAAAAWDVSETVDVEPWTPYVSVPDNIVTDPPKTGDVSVLGFVLIAMAAAAAVVVRKVRA